MRTMKIIAIAVSTTLPFAQPAHAQIVASSGADYSSGRYGTGQRISIATASLGLRAAHKRLTIFAAIPVVRIDAPANVVVTGGPLGLPLFADPTRPATRIRRSGLGDATIGGAYQLLDPKPGRVALALTGSIKLPTASAARGLGTGKTDFAIAADVARAGKITPFAQIAYTVVGQPASFRLKNIVAAKGGVALRVGKTSNVSLSYSYASRAIAGIADRRELGAGLETALSNRLSVGVQGSVGLSRSAPAAGAGLRLGLRL